MNMRKIYFLFALALTVSFGSYAAEVDSIDIASAAMGKTFKAAVALPDSYKKNKASYPVLYLLHGGGGHFRDWLTLVPDKSLVKTMADEFNIIVVMPEGEVGSFYVNSPVDKQSQFETYITQEVITKIDATYRTVKDKKGRAITGLSMGGHGSLYLSTRHPDLYCAAGSMSGALDLEMSNWKLTPDFAKRVNTMFKSVFGPDSTTWGTFAVLNMSEKIKSNGLKIIIDCGVDDFLIESNRELHRRLVYNHTPHDYTERPGGHSWDYWQNSLPYHVWYFFNVFRTNGVTVSPN